MFRSYATKKPHLFSLVFEAEGETLLLHGDEAAARLSFPAIDRNIQRQAGILVIQPVGAQVADKVVQCCDSMDNQLRTSNFSRVAPLLSMDFCFIERTYRRPQPLIEAHSPQTLRFGRPDRTVRMWL